MSVVRHESYYAFISYKKVTVKNTISRTARVSVWMARWPLSDSNELSLEPSKYHGR